MKVVLTTKAFDQSVASKVRDIPRRDSLNEQLYRVAQNSQTTKPLGILADNKKQAETLRASFIAMAHRYLNEKRFSTRVIAEKDGSVWLVVFPRKRTRRSKAVKATV